MVLSDSRVILKPGREKSLLRRHPWIFSGAIDRVIGNPSCGSSIRIESSNSSFLGWGAFSPSSQIRIRVWSWDEEILINEDLIDARISQAASLREKFFLTDVTDSYRVIHSESDGLPGLIVDRYNDWLVIQILSCGAEQWRDAIVAKLANLYQPRGIYERSDVDVRELEGLEMRTGMLWGDVPPDNVQIHAHGLKYWVDLKRGHKTGFYLDQRENHKLVSSIAQGFDVLDCFSYSGGFNLGALASGAASVTAVDSSSEAQALNLMNVDLNKLNRDSFFEIRGDVFQVLRKMRDEGRAYDLIVLDPPKFAPTNIQVQKAARGYKDINLLAFKLLKPGGFLITFSCSGGVDRILFQKIVASAALDAGFDAQIIQYLHQAKDHPIGLAFPEGEYLKGLIARKL